VTRSVTSEAGITKFAERSQHMLVLTRRRGERIKIGDDIEVIVTRVVDGAVRLAIVAPKTTKIVRTELVKR
jgi:carbon storage regulator